MLLCVVVSVDARLNVELGSFVYPSLMLEGNVDNLGVDLTSSVARRMHSAKGAFNNCSGVSDGAGAGGEGNISRRKR